MIKQPRMSLRNKRSFTRRQFKKNDVHPSFPYKNSKKIETLRDGGKDRQDQKSAGVLTLHF